MNEAHGKEFKIDEHIEPRSPQTKHLDYEDCEVLKPKSETGSSVNSPKFDDHIRSLGTVVIQTKGEGVHMSKTKTSKTRAHLPKKIMQKITFEHKNTDLAS